MRCPFCGGIQDKVVDSRESRDGLVVRRRRQCIVCERRFTSYERVDEIAYQVVKKDERREPYSREKLLAGLRKACQKRPIAPNALEKIADEVEEVLHGRDDREIPVQDIGEHVMRRLQELDRVAYIRFASVYRDFQDVTDFTEELEKLGARRGKGGGAERGGRPEPAEP